MAKQLNYQVNLTVNKEGLNELLASLRKIQQDQVNAINLGTLTSDLDKAGDAATKLERVLNKSWNSKIGQLDLSKLSTEIDSAYGSVSNLKTQLESVGMGQYFNQLQSEVLNTNLQLKQSNKLLDEMATSMANTVKWGITSSIFNNIASSIQKAWSYTKELDTSLNDIRIVTDKSADSMASFAKQANSAAKALGASTRDYTEASLIYYQQGLTDEEVQARTETTIKAANVEGAGTEDVSEELTAVWNGYQVSAEETELYVDKLSAVAAATASDLEELSTGMSKVASAANSAGVDVDQLNGILSTVISVTREAPETVGTAFKTIFARLGDLSIDGQDEFGVKLGTVSGQMEKLGIQILDESGDMRDMGDIIEDTAEKWQTWTNAQKQAAAVAMAGKQQYSRLISLFDNWNMYTEALETSQNAVGTLQEQQDIYMESVEAHLQKLSTEAERTYDILFDTDSVNSMTDAMTGLLTVFNNFLSGMGGGLSSIAGLASIGTRIFNKQIGKGLGGLLENREVDVKNAQSLKTYQDFASTPISPSANEEIVQIYEQARLKAQELSTLTKSMSTEEFNKLVIMQKEATEAALQNQALKEAIVSDRTVLEINADLEDQKSKILKIQKQYTALANKDTIYQGKAPSKNVEKAEQYNTLLEQRQGIYENISTIVDRMIKQESQEGGNTEKLEQYKQYRQELTEIGELNLNYETGYQRLKAVTNKMLQTERIELDQITEELKARKLVDDLQQDKAMADNNKKIDSADEELAMQQRQQNLQILVKNLSSMVTFASTFVGIVKTLNDDSLSGWEKFSTIGTTLLFTLPQLITFFTTFKQVITISSTGMHLFASAEAAAAAGAVTMKLSMIEIYAILALIVAAVALVVAGVKALSDAYNADAIAAEKAAAAAKEVSETNEELQQSFEDLKSTIDTYDSAVDKLKECTKGTEEWKEALEEVNEAAVAALEAVPDNYDISELYDRDSETGEIVLDSDKMEAILDTSELQATASQLATYTSSTRATLAQASADLIDTTRDMSGEMLNANDAIGLMAGTISGGVIGSFVGLAAANEAEAQKIQDKIIDNIDEFAETMTLDEFKDKLNSLGIDISSLSNTELTTFKNEISEVATEANNAADKLRTLAEIQISDLLGDKYDETVGKVATESVLKRQNEIYDEVIEKSHEASNVSGADSDTYTNLSSRIEKATGGAYSATTGNVVTGWDSNRQYVFEDEEGEKVTKTEAWVANTIAAYEALQKVTDDANKVTEVFNNLDKSLNENLVNGIKNFISSGNLESLTEEELQQIASMTKQDLANAMGIAVDEVDNMLGEYDWDSLQKAVSNYDTALDNYVNSLYYSVQDAFKSIDTSKLSLTGKKTIGDMLNKAWELNQDTEDVEAMKNLIQSIPQDELDEFSTTLNNIDWSSVDSITDLSNILKEAGITTNFTTEQLQLLTNILGSLSATAEETYAEIHEIIDSLRRGDTISAEDYEKLPDAAQQYFQLMLDGTYKLIGQADDLQRATQDYLLQDKVDQLKEYDDKIAQYQSLRGLTANDLKDLSTAADKLKASSTNANAVANMNQSFKNLQAITNNPAMLRRSLYTTPTYSLNGLQNINLNKTLKNASQDLSGYSSQLDVIFNKVNNNTSESSRLIANLNEQYGTTLGQINSQANLELRNINKQYKIISDGIETTAQEVSKGIATASEETTKQINTQFAILKAFDYGANDEEKTKNLSTWIDDWNNNKMTAETYENIANAVGEVTKEFSSWDELIDAVNEKSRTLQTQIAYSATSMEQLKEWDEKYNLDNDIVGEAQLELWDTSKTEDLDMDTVESYSNYIKEIAADTAEFSDELDEAGKSSEELEAIDEISDNLAVQIMNMSDAVGTLSENWEDWSDILKNSSKSSEEYYEALTDSRDAISKLLDISEEYISEDFIIDHMNDIAAAAQGDEDAIDRLRAASLDSIMVNVSFAGDTDLENTFLNAIHGLQSIADSANLTVGASLDLSQFATDEGNYLEILNNMIANGQATAADVNAALSSIGYNPVWNEETVETTTKVPVTTTHHTIVKKGSSTITAGKDENGNPITYDVDNWDDIATTETTYTNEEGQVDVVGLGTEENPPEVTGSVSVNGAKTSTTTTHLLSGVSKKATGSYNNYSSSNAGGGSPSGSSDSGSGSSSEPKTEDKIESDLDPYHDIDVIIKQIQDDLDTLQKQQEKFFGQNLINNLNKQYETLQKEIDAYTEKIKIAQGEASRLQGELSGYGVTFNDDGTVANYTAAYTAQLNYVNSIIDAYNGMSADEQESYQDTLDKAKENFETFKDKLSEYEETVNDLIPELESNIQDAIDEQIEIKIEEFTMEIEIRLDMSEAERDWNEFKRKVIDGIKDDDILGNTKSKLADFSSYYKQDSTGEVQALTKQVNNTLEQLKQIDKTGWADFYGDDKAQALEDLKEYNDELMSSLEDVEDLVEEIKESYLDMMDEAADKFSDQVTLYEQVKDLIDHDMNIITMVYGEDSYKELEAYYQKQEDNYNAMLDFQRQQKDFWYDQMQAIAAAGGENSEAWLQAKENWLDAVNEWNSAIEEAIENLQDKYLNTINAIFDELNDKVTSGAGLDYVSEEWELINDNADQYLDTINAIYETQELENKYLDAIDDTDSITAQQKLNDLMNEELDALREKDKLTQYDIDRANLKYEIALKQIALEEAQQNKSTMRLRRDSQGNYTYQYVSDEDEVAKLKEELSDLYNELYNFDLSAYQDNLDQIYSVWEEYQEKMKEAAQINDPEERQQRELLLQEQYGELINGLVEQNEDIRSNLYQSSMSELFDLYNQNEENYDNMTQEQQDALDNYLDTQYDTTNAAFNNLFDIYDKSIDQFKNMTDEEINNLEESFIPQWESGVQHMADVFANEGGFVPVCKDAMEELDNATQDYEDSLNDLQDTAGEDFAEIQDGIDDTIDETQELIENNDELIESYEDELEAIGEIIKQLQALETEYDTAKQKAIEATQAAYAYWQEQQRQAAAAASSNVSGSSGSSNSNSSGNNSNNSSGKTSSGSESGDGEGGATVGNQITYSGKYYYDSYGTSPAGSKYSGVTNGVTIDIVNNNPYGIHVKSTDGKYKDLGWIKKSQVTRWNTGGYTGDWGDDSGRLGILDRKEIVLNKDDTANFLSAIQVTRDLTNSMNASMLQRIADSINGVQTSLSGVSADSDTLEQNVHIEATFPGVKDASEIEKALNNLTNMASQRIGRNRR